MIKNNVGNNLENSRLDVSKIRETLDNLDALKENEKELDYLMWWIKKIGSLQRMNQIEKVFQKIEMKI